MIGFLTRRLLAMLPLLAGIVVVVFGLMHLIPGDPAAVLAGEQATPEAVAELRRALGLDRSLPEQLGRYISNLFRGDLGRSLFQNEPVVNIISERLPATAELALVALVFAIVFGALLGILSAARPRSAIDRLGALLAQLMVSVPVFWLGVLLMYAFAVRLGWFPSVGRGEPLGSALLDAVSGSPEALIDSLKHLTLPAITLASSHAAIISRLVRASLLGTLGEEYVRAARARGVSDRLVVLHHALRPALTPVVTVLGVRFGVMLGGAVLTESIFGWPGLGQLAVTAISQRDIPLVQGVVLSFALVFTLLNLAVDVLSGALDPRIREAENA